MKRTILIALLVVLAIGALAVTYNTRWDSSIFIKYLFTPKHEADSLNVAKLLKVQNATDTMKVRPSYVQGDSFLGKLVGTWGSSGSYSAFTPSPIPPPLCTALWSNDTSAYLRRHALADSAATAKANTGAWKGYDTTAYLPRGPFTLGKNWFSGDTWFVQISTTDTAKFKLCGAL